MMAKLRMLGFALRIHKRRPGMKDASFDASNGDAEIGDVEIRNADGTFRVYVLDA